MDTHKNVERSIWEEGGGTHGKKEHYQFDIINETHLVQ
jgi:hypothetical protein